MKDQKGFAYIFLLLLVVFIALVFFLTKPWEKWRPTKVKKPSPQGEVFCQPNKVYVNLAACQCPQGTTKAIETPEGGEEAVLICKTR